MLYDVDWQADMAVVHASATARSVDEWTLGLKYGSTATIQPFKASRVPLALEILQQVCVSCNQFVDVCMFPIKFPI